jgi:hypothetical protein
MTSDYNAARFPAVGKYQATTARQIPVFVLTST